MKKKVIITNIVIIIYIVVMYMISSTQTYQKVYLEAGEDRYEMSSKDSGMLQIGLGIDNKSNKAVSSQLEDTLIYDIYLFNGEDYTFLGSNTLQNSLGNILPDSQKVIDVDLYIPPKSGVYKIVIDINRGQKSRLSECGMSTYEAIVEVK